MRSQGDTSEILELVRGGQDGWGTGVCIRHLMSMEDDSVGKHMGQEADDFMVVFSILEDGYIL